MEIQEYNGTSLAYMGDAVMSLYVRELLLSKGYQKSKDLQKFSEAWVSAKAQAGFLNQLETEGFFTEEEWAIVLRGRNTNPKSKAKNADVITYRKATNPICMLRLISERLSLRKYAERWCRYCLCPFWPCCALHIYRHCPCA